MKVWFTTLHHIIGQSLLLFYILTFNNTFSQNTKAKEDSLYIRTHYTKMERMIPMRDGVKLFTSIYVPKAVSTGAKFPIMLNRTPYSSAPYGDTLYKISLGPSMLFARDGYIFVYQDVRGKYMSEGDFEAYRPFIPQKKNKTRTILEQNKCICNKVYKFF